MWSLWRKKSHIPWSQRLQCLGSTRSGRWHSTSCKQPTPQLSWHQLYHASRLARWSGLCYYPPDRLPELCESEGLKLVAHGRTKYTSWIVADGRVDYAHLADMARRVPGSRSTSTSSGSPAGSSQAAAGSSSTASGSSAGGDGSRDGLPADPVCRHVFIRGVQWSARELDVTRLSLSLANFWPEPFAGHLTQPPGALVAHAGVASFALDLWQTVLPHIQLATSAADAAASSSSGSGGSSGSNLGSTASAAAPAAADAGSRCHSGSQASVSQTAVPAAHGTATSSNSNSISGEQQQSAALSAAAAPLPLCFAGHSLGGALGVLLWALASLNRLRPPSDLSAYTFGSPPVLAHAEGAGGPLVMQAVGAVDEGAVRSFVLENDPVPWALVNATPYLSALNRLQPVQQLLAARDWLMGSKASQPPPPRVAYDSVGSVYLMKGGCEVVPLQPGADSLQALLASAPKIEFSLMAQPARALQLLLDHHHNSYAHDLEAAAVAALRRQLRQQQRLLPGAPRKVAAAV